MQNPDTHAFRLARIYYDDMSKYNIVNVEEETLREQMLREGKAAISDGIVGLESVRVTIVSIRYDSC